MDLFSCAFSVVSAQSVEKAKMRDTENEAMRNGAILSEIGMAKRTREWTRCDGWQWRRLFTGFEMFAVDVLERNCRLNSLAFNDTRMRKTANPPIACNYRKLHSTFVASSFHLLHFGSLFLCLSSSQYCYPFRSFVRSFAYAWAEESASSIII